MKIDTLCVQGGWSPKCGEPRQVPIYSSTTFRYDTTQHMADLFDLKAFGYFYTRVANPTNDQVAKKIAEDYGAYFVPLQEKFDEATKECGTEPYLFDGVHPTAAGAKLIATEWLKVFDKIKE